VEKINCGLQLREEGVGEALELVSAPNSLAYEVSRLGAISLRISRSFLNCGARTRP
jgi:hypothetical protein